MKDKDIIMRALAANKFTSVKIDADHKTAIRDAALADFTKQVKSSIRSKKTIHLVIVST